MEKRLTVVLGTQKAQHRCLLLHTGDILCCFFSLREEDVLVVIGVSPPVCWHRRSLEMKEMSGWCGVYSFWIDFETPYTGNASSRSSDWSPQGMGNEYSLCSGSAHRRSGARREEKDQETVFSWRTPVAEATSLRAGMLQNLHEEEDHRLTCS